MEQPQWPSVSRMVHYVSHGTPPRPDGSQVFTSKCRAAVITEVGQWVTVKEEAAASYSASEGRPIRRLEQWFYSDAVALTVLNPTGQFLNGAGAVPCKYDDAAEPAGGTWHWPERL